MLNTVSSVPSQTLISIKRIFSVSPERSFPCISPVSFKLLRCCYIQNIAPGPSIDAVFPLCHIPLILAKIIQIPLLIAAVFPKRLCICRWDSVFTLIRLYFIPFSWLIKPSGSTPILLGLQVPAPCVLWENKCFFFPPINSELWFPPWKGRVVLSFLLHISLFCPPFLLKSISYFHPLLRWSTYRGWKMDLCG